MTKMSISEHANLAECLNRAILGRIFPTEILDKKVNS